MTIYSLYTAYEIQFFFNFRKFKLKRETCILVFDSFLAIVYFKWFIGFHHNIDGVGTLVFVHKMY